jgi:hypothetical protein
MMKAYLRLMLRKILSALRERWHLYIDAESSPKLDDLLKEVDRDPTGIFWG